MYLTRNIVARSHNQCCCGKAIRITYSECVSVCSLSYPACKTHASCYIIICGLSGSTTLSHIISQKKYLQRYLFKIKCAISVPLLSSSEIYLIQRRL